MQNPLLFHITPERGFLPSTNPLAELPLISDLNQKLVALAHDIPTLIKTKSLRSEIDKMNLVFSNQLVTLEKNNAAQINTAIVTLLMLAQAYIWETPENPAHTIPSLLAKNLYLLCKQQQRFPTLTYADYVLHNWKLINPKNGITLDNIEPIFSFTGTPDEAWFIKIHVVIEAVCGKALSAAYQLCNLTQQYSQTTNTQLCQLLDEITFSLQDATQVLEKMLNGCNPTVYWDSIRKYLNGWEQVKTGENKEKAGVILEDVVIKDKLPNYCYKGASGAQSSIIPALDAALGIKHDIDSMFQTLLAFQQYMPSEHQLTINLLKQSRIEQTVESSQSEELNTAWQNAINKLRLFRSSHIKLIAHYIYRPAEKQGIRPDKIIGTGGSSINDYLINRLESTTGKE